MTTNSKPTDVIVLPMLINGEAFEGAATLDVINPATEQVIGRVPRASRDDLDIAVAVAEQLEAGTVWINETIYLTPLQPFGGHKQSGLGVENGMDGLLEYTNIQVISVPKT